MAAAWAGPPGGPPVLLTRMCTGARAASAATAPRSASVSATSATRKPCACRGARGNAAAISAQHVRAAREQGDVGAQLRQFDGCGAADAF